MVKRVPPPALSTEQIYDALFDDDAFEQLPDLLAKSVGARSATLGWRHAGGMEVLQHNGYFTDAHFADYAANYANGDPWIAVAHRPHGMNRAICMDEEIGAAEVKRTAFYNDWLRGMGDDTLHCLGAATRVREGEGIIGLHRGPSARGAFTAAEAGRLADVFPHLSRLLVLRGRLAAADRQTRSLAEALDLSGLAMILVDGAGRISIANGHGEGALRSGALASVYADGKLCGPRHLLDAVSIATRPVAPSAHSILVASHERAPLSINVTPFADASGVRRAMLLFRAPMSRPSKIERLRMTYRLTAAEADVALRLAHGGRLADIASQRGTSLQTTRTQLRTINEKLGCRRQAELVALVSTLVG